MMVSAKSLTYLLPILSLLVGLYRFIDARLDNFYIFDQKQLHDIAKRAVAHGDGNMRLIRDFIVAELRNSEQAKYVNFDEEWVFNNAGGAMGAMWILHASITEYLIIFGTPLGTEGHSGRHTANNFFHILHGTQTAFATHSNPHTPPVFNTTSSTPDIPLPHSPFEPEVYPPGSVNVTPRGTVKQYKMHKGCFALEYMRGWIPPLLFFGYADGFTSTLDFGTLWRTTWITAKQMVGNLMLAKF